MFNIHKSADGQFYFTITAKNGQVLVTSETYKQHASAMKGINAVKKVTKTFIIKDLSK